MEYEDIRTLATPEGVELALPLGGLGSRFMALALDIVVEGLVLIAFAFVLDSSGTGGQIAFALIAFLVLFGYHVLFEVFGGGRTLGKRVAGLRVVRDSGAPVGLRASLIRNLIRLIEGYALLYVPAIVSVLATSGNQRLGDLAGGTLVVRDARGAPPMPSLGHVAPASVESWDVSAVREEELALVRRFLSRRPELDAEPRELLGAQLAERLRPRVAGAPQLADDDFLEHLAVAKAGRAD